MEMMAEVGVRLQLGVLWYYIYMLLKKRIIKKE